MIRERVGVAGVVRPQARIRSRVQPHAPDRGLLFEHDHVELVVTQHLRGHEPCDARADHGNPVAAFAGHVTRRSPKRIAGLTWAACSPRSARAGPSWRTCRLTSWEPRR